MDDLEKGIINLTEKLKDQNLSSDVKSILSFQLSSMQIQLQTRERNPRQFYKDEP